MFESWLEITKWSINIANNYWYLFYPFCLFCVIIIITCNIKTKGDKEK